MRVRLTLLTLALCVLAAPPAHAAETTADYQFDGNLSSSVPGAPALGLIGSDGAYNYQTVFGPGLDRIKEFPVAGGFAFNPAGLYRTPDQWTLTVRFKLSMGTAGSAPSGGRYSRLLDFSGGTSDYGIYVYQHPTASGSKVVLYNGSTPSSPVVDDVPNGVWVELTLDRTGPTIKFTVRNQSSTVIIGQSDPTGVTNIGPAGIRFFKDNDTGGGPNESRAGAVDRITFTADRPLPVAGPAVASVTTLKLSPKKVKRKKKGKVTYSLSAPTKVSFTATSKKKPKGKKKAKVVKLGTQNGKAGANTFKFSTKKLKKGKYTLAATPAGGAPKTATLTVK